MNNDNFHRWFLQQKPTNDYYFCSYYMYKLCHQSSIQLADAPDKKTVDHFIEFGFRRSGNIYYTYRCEQCQICLGYRLPVESFSFNQWQRRSLKRTQHWTMKIQPPRNTSVKKRLYLAYQYKRHFLVPGEVDIQSDNSVGIVSAIIDDRRKNMPTHFSARNYLRTMCQQMYKQPENSLEIEIYDKDKLIGFGVFDIGHTMISYVYQVYDLDYAGYSPGTVMILRLMEWAKQNGFLYLFLGLYLPNHPKMKYKIRFQPAEILNPWTNLWEEANGFMQRNGFYLEMQESINDGEIFL